MKNNNSTTFFVISGMFLTDCYYRDEIIKMLDRGEALPVSEAFEDWDVDYLLEFIDNMVDTIMTDLIKYEDS